MDLEYEYKLEEMQKYIPFLESMITRLETANPSSLQPRQAQLEKMKTLKDLLLDRKKRMKMENLLKCEQVLSNLYTKVEQSDTLPGIIKASQDSSEASTSNINESINDLDVVRTKLKNAMTKTHEEIKKTLPDIEVAGDLYNSSQIYKEPALFQRRPDVELAKETPSSSYNNYYISSCKLNSRENFCSQTPKRESSPSGKNLYTRRNSRTDKNSKKIHKMNFKFTIPEDKLNALNTNDILPRIMNCSDSDHEITTLRRLRTQILDELDKTDASNNLSKLLKSFKEKKADKCKQEVEEGELTDSDTEKRENVSGKIVLLKNDEFTNHAQGSGQVEICLVVDTKEVKPYNSVSAEDTDFSDFEINEDNDSDSRVKNDFTPTIQSPKDKYEVKPSNDQVKENEKTNPTPHNTLKTTSSSARKTKTKYQETLSEIDILNALKKEILEENICSPIPEKISFVEPSKDITNQDDPPTNISNNQTQSKRRISLEKYKQNSVRWYSPVMANRANDIQIDVSKATHSNDKKQNVTLQAYRNPDPPERVPSISSNTAMETNPNCLVGSINDVEKMLEKLCPDLINSLMPVPDMVSKNFGSPNPFPPNSKNQWKCSDTQQHTHINSPIQKLNTSAISKTPLFENHFQGRIENKLHEYPIAQMQLQTDNPTKSQGFSTLQQQFNFRTGQGMHSETPPSSLTGCNTLKQQINTTGTSHNKYNQLEIFKPNKSDRNNHTWRPQDPRLNRNLSVIKKDNKPPNLSMNSLPKVESKNKFGKPTLNHLSTPKVSPVANAKVKSEQDRLSDCDIFSKKQKFISQKASATRNKIKFLNEVSASKSINTKISKKLNSTGSKLNTVHTSNTCSSINQFKIPKIKRQSDLIVGTGGKDEASLKERYADTDKPTKKGIEVIKQPLKTKKKTRILLPCSDSDDEFEMKIVNSKSETVTETIIKNEDREESKINVDSTNSPEVIAKQYTKRKASKTKIAKKITSEPDNDKVEVTSSSFKETNEASEIENMPDPDSTFSENVKNNGKERIVRDEMNISSEKLSNELSSTKTEMDVDSIISILQDKSKINELLKKLQGAFENKKLKKRLEKLSELSDDEGEDNDAKLKTNENNESSDKSLIMNSLAEKEFNKKPKEVSVTSKNIQTVKRNIPIRQGKNKAISKKEAAEEYEELLHLLSSTKATASSRELKNLEKDIIEMMSTVARNKKELPSSESKKPIVVLERLPNPVKKESGKKQLVRKPSPKSKKIQDSSDDETPLINTAKKNKAGAKSWTKKYVKKSNNIKDNNTSLVEVDSDSEIDKVIVKPVETKKKRKRRRGKWELGVIKTNKPKKQKMEVQKLTATCKKSSSIKTETEEKIEMDVSFFTDLNYCFFKTSVLCCRFCPYIGDDLTHHHKQMHRDYEVPFSRLNPEAAQHARTQCENLDFKKINAISTDGFICRFCDKQFDKQALAISFFWHVVTAHTGEYVIDPVENSEMGNRTFKLDIPSPPKGPNEQITGYLCGKCNYTQISLENVKKHVVLRHNDEKTAVYNITLSDLSNKIVNALCDDVIVLKSEMNLADEPSQSPFEAGFNVQSTNLSMVQTSKQPVILFEENNDIDLESVKGEESVLDVIQKTHNLQSEVYLKNEPLGSPDSDKTDVLDDKEDIVLIKQNETLPQFKIVYTETGAKQYICCLDENIYFKTSLIIAMRNHVSKNHLNPWDGYCFVCKLMVMPHGHHTYKDCLEHYTDKHDTAPLTETEILPNEFAEDKTVSLQLLPKIASVVSLGLSDVTKINSCDEQINRPVISLRPLSELMSKEALEESSLLPVIKNVVSLDHNRSKIPNRSEVNEEIKSFLSIEAKPQLMVTLEQSLEEVMSNKNRIILDTMMTKEKAVQIFKCAGSFCSFTSNSAEDSLIHVSNHKNLEDGDALVCAYCKFDPDDNVIDLVSHVFNKHGHCEYACSLCFYRAVASQLVGAHIARRHETLITATVLRSLFVTPSTVDSDSERLSRQDAVPHYACFAEDCSPACTFRTYTAGKFFEHLQSNHTDDVHKCYICKAEHLNPSDLVQHMGVHGMKLYQCTRCVFGADDEKELLAHASEMHYYLPPEAYLRIIINKGVSNFKVLPLAQFKSQISYKMEDVRSTVKEDPVKEVERSVELRKLIGQKVLVVEQVNNSTQPKETEQELVKLETDETPEVSDIIDFDNKSKDLGIYDYRCPKCKAIFHRMRFRLHLKDCYHRGSVFPCAYCPFKGTHKQLINHIGQSDVSHFNRKDLYDVASVRFICAVCTRRESHQDQIVFHYQEVHGVECVIMRKDETFMSKQFHTMTPNTNNTEIEKALKSKTLSPTLRFACGYCSFGCRFTKSCKTHVSEVHGIHDTVCFSRVIGKEENAIQFIFIRSQENMDDPDSGPPAKKSRYDNAGEVIDLESSSQANRPRIYPQLVPLPNRYNCSVVGCDFTGDCLYSFQTHWKEYHLDTIFSCDHCTWKHNFTVGENIKALRHILDHLQMHGSVLYACVLCGCYHHHKAVLRLHFLVNHAEEKMQIEVVRNKVASEWQCGLCKFTSEIVSTIIQHCKEVHNVEKQYRCGHCNYSDYQFSAVKAHHNSHEFAEEMILYLYYKIGTVPNELEGCPRWVKQQERLSQIESLAAVDSITDGSSTSINVNADPSGLSLELLCKKYGEIRDPSGGVKYLCPLCDLTFPELSKEEFVSHLHEELNYRRWGCSMCHYKAFHKEGLDKHMMLEHRQIRLHYLLPIDNDIESWVDQLLNHQTSILLKNKENTKSQEAMNVEGAMEERLENRKNNEVDLKLCFGEYGMPIGNRYCCPMCEETSIQKESMIVHLQNELKKIGWRCSNCPETFKLFHEALLHWRTEHPGEDSCPKEVQRNKQFRDAWVHAAVEEQAHFIKLCPYDELPETLP